ncbi:MAG TPA: GNAT family N-acetyltransferase [Gaiellaceae bacterium]|nr:GNAT family N-acetyltransferase [Gaiellaceae bacterium]
MEVVNVADPAEWLERAAPLLLANEARHNLILGIAGTLRQSSGLYAEHELWLVADGGAVVGAALRTPPYNLVLGGGSDAALELMARELGGSIPGAVGSVPEIDVFIQACAAAHGVVPEPHMRQGVYALDQVVQPPRPPGRPRPATEADLPLVMRWWGEFGAEALGALEQDEEQNARSVRHRLTTPRNGIELWENGGEPVSLVGYGSPTPTGVRIGPVYTPREHRGRGYARALTAYISAAQLAAGRDFCFLYTDLANPTSNRIYVAIGYHRVCDSTQYRFA